MCSTALFCALECDRLRKREWFTAKAANIWPALMSAVMAHPAAPIHTPQIARV